MHQIGTADNADDTPGAGHGDALNTTALHHLDGGLERFSPIVHGSGVMISRTFPPHVCTYSWASLPGPRMNSSHFGRCRWAPSSPRRRKSPSVTIPTSSPSLSSTGKPLMW